MAQHFIEEIMLREVPVSWAHRGMCRAEEVVDAVSLFSRLRLSISNKSVPIQIVAESHGHTNFLACLTLVLYQTYKPLACTSALSIHYVIGTQKMAGVDRRANPLSLVGRGIAIKRAPCTKPPVTIRTTQLVRFLFRFWEDRFFIYFSVFFLRYFLLFSFLFFFYFIFIFGLSFSFHKHFLKSQTIL